MLEVKVDLEKCPGCGACVTTSPIEVFERKKIDESKKSKPINKEQDIACRCAKCNVSNLQIIISE